MELISSNQPPPKRTNLETEMDRISTLPDEVLTHILSFLSTKMSYRTSLLSSRWETLWTFVPNLDFRPSEDNFWQIDKNPDPRYMNFIDDVLLSHKSSINKFHLKFAYEFDISRVTAWIHAAVKRNVRDIDIYGQVKADNKLLLLPKNLYTCKTLVRLRIGLYFQLDVPSSIHLPCLKCLDISVVSPGAELTQKLFCSSPVLEELTIHTMRDSGKMIYNIASPVLKKLDMSILPFDIESSDSVVVIDAPVLESFEVSDYCFNLYNFKDSSSLLKARIYLDPLAMEALGQRRHAERLFTLVKSVSAVKDLSIKSSSFVAAFDMATETKWEVIPNVTRLTMAVDNGFSLRRLSRWPDLPSLTHLSLVTDDEVSSKNLLNLLVPMPNLVSLVIFKLEYSTWSVSFGKQVVPRCFRTCLREIKVRLVDGSPNELKLIRYLLANAEVLENLKLKGLLRFRFADPLNVELFESQIRRMQRCSKDCKISIRWKKVAVSVNS